MKRTPGFRTALVLCIALAASSVTACGAPRPGATGTDTGDTARQPGDRAVLDSVPLDEGDATGDTTPGQRDTPDPDPASGDERRPTMFVASTTAAPTPITLPKPMAACGAVPGSSAAAALPGVLPPVEPGVQATLDGALAELRSAGRTVGVSVWTDGNGEVLANEGDAAIPPASNQKLRVAFAALDLLGGDTTLHTDVIATGPLLDGSLQGDLVLVAGGDPTVTRTGPHSLAALAAQVAEHGITRVEGSLLVDETRYDSDRTPNGWPDALSLANVGSLSALVVDRNRNLTDPTVSTDPALAGGRAFAAELGKVGVTVSGPIEHGSEPLGLRVATMASPNIADLTSGMLAISDNLVAELLVKEIGLRHGGKGTTADGLATIDDLLSTYCGIGAGTNEDGSGLSSIDRQTARNIRRTLQTAQTRPWFPTFQGGLPVSGRSGTLSSRLKAPTTVGKVRAKTGSLASTNTLSGYLTTAKGTPVTFSILVGSPGPGAEAAVDRFVTTLVTTL